MFASSFFILPAYSVSVVFLLSILCIVCVAGRVCVWLVILTFARVQQLEESTLAWWQLMEDRD